ncbi:MAG: hemolysin family protein [Clostridium sp.]
MDSSDSSSLSVQIILIFILVFINAFFAAAEMAIVSLNKNKINLLCDNGNKKALLIQKLLKEPNSFLATIQIGITFAGFFASASAATSISSYFSVYLKNFNIPYSNEISIFIITIMISYITLVLGELFPKRIALQNSEKIAMFTVKPILFISKITNPFVKLLSWSTSLLVRLFGLKMSEGEDRVSREEIKSMLLAGKENGLINDIEEEMIHSIFDFDNTIAKEIMTPRTEVFTINVTTPINDIASLVIEEKFTRIPIYEDNTDNIIGILYIKDLFEASLKHGIDNVNILNIIRPACFFPETKNIDDLFNELKSTKSHIAILIDEYGGFSGIATVEDIVEEVMGSIIDEYDDQENEISKIDNNTYIVDGLLPIDEFNEYFDLSLESQTADTIGGFVLDLIGSIPTSEENYSTKYDDILFEVYELDERRIQAIKVIFNEKG